MSSRSLIALVVCLASFGCRPARTGPTPVSPVLTRYPIIPWPQRLVSAPGSFVLDSSTRIVLTDTTPTLRSAAELLATPLRASTGLPLPIVVSTSADTTDAIVLDPHTSTDVSSSSLADPERYTLAVNERGATLSAASLPGIVDAIETLRQLLPPSVDATHPAAVPAVAIEDAPRFRYRGILLDVARHYFPLDFLHQLVDAMALYKLNTLQLHLTDDQGWRLEIRKYPKLTEVGAWRKETVVGQHFEPYVGDHTPHGGFYTQDQMRELVAYAAARNVTIVPEIEMPGHAGAAIAAYPELACTPGPFEVSTTWGVHEDIFCPSEQTFAFLEDVLTEVMQVFPSEYIHVGGDEVPKTRWKASALAQDVIRREGLKNEEELQSYFIRRIERFLRDHGRKLIGWDEILEGGIAPEATVMSWRGIDGGIAAARQGHDVIMTPTDYAYLDMYQGDPASEPLAIGGYIPLDTVYHWEPVPTQLTPEQATHVIGAQGNLWSEYVATPKHAEYMLFPRAIALSEVFWSPKDARDWNGFIARLPSALARLDALGVNYRVPDPVGLVDERKVLEDHARLAMSTFMPGSVIRYTLDGTEPTSTSEQYTAPVDVRVTPTPTIVSARLFLPSGKMSGIVRERLSRATWHDAVYVRPEDMQPGLAYAYVEGEFESADSVRTEPPSRTGTVPRVMLRGDERPEHYGVHLTGFIHVPGDALYTFSLTSDDGAKLRIDGELVVDHDGEHGATAKERQVALRAGYHAIDVVYFQAGGGAALKLEVGAPRLKSQEVPAAWLSSGTGIKTQ